MHTIVALDLETTGLHAENDAIIEIGAVRFNGNQIEEEWTSLVNPGRPIPQAITQMTGIAYEMVAGAPFLDDVYDEFLAFVGESPVLGHNVGFDASFLRRHGGFMSNPLVDTFEMAAVLLPSAERYALGVLGKILDLPDVTSSRQHGAHSALYDARLCHLLFLRLFEMAKQLPVDLLGEIVRLSEGVDWDGRWAFEQAYFTLLDQPLHASAAKKRRVSDLSFAPLFNKDGKPAALPSLQPAQQVQPLDAEETAAVLQPGGLFSHHFSQFEHRPEQVEMLRSVTRALSEGRHLLVEAGTGIGKSIAYLVPAALHALHNQQRVVISTNTINLQEQLISKDIPDVEKALGLNLWAAVLKGRANYICPRRLKALMRSGLQTADQVRVVAKVLVWLQNSRSGDRNELTMSRPGENQVWAHISAEDEGCSADNCIKYSGGTCPFHRAHLAAQSAHLLIVNHALLLSDVATGNRVLPEYDYLIVDEGHHLEEASTNALSYQITQADIERLLHELGGVKSGLLGRLLLLTRRVISPETYAGLEHLMEHVSTLAFRFEQLNNQFFVLLGHFCYEQRQGKMMGPYAQQERILPSTRTLPAWMDVEVSWDEAEQSYKALLEDVNQLVQQASKLADQEIEEMSDLSGSLADLYRRLDLTFQQMHAIVFKPAVDQIYWVEILPNGKRLTIQAAPLHIGSLMERYLWYAKTSVIVTSATLTTGGEFDYIRQQLNAFDAEELALGSPYDFENSALLYLVNDIPEPNEQGYQKAVERGLIQLCRTVGGKTLVLFTAYTQLRSTAQAITPVLNKAGITILEQGEGASRHALLETFRASKGAVLLGTRSFWEGVDVPGDALSVLVMTKLPFAVPSDPIVAARAETFDDPFSQFQLPEAVLQFRQGFGRLIRSHSDRGVVAVFDRRVLTKQYGKAFIASLPPCTKRAGPLADLAGAAAQWLNL
jgi:ATP-dependent DNA helicase DinG